MSRRKKENLILQRLCIWALYLFSGCLLYSRKTYLFPFFITFAKVIYPLSIFWIQIRLKTKNKLLPIDTSMTTSELWFNLLPVVASIITVILSLLNMLFYITAKLF